jgi:hypothetical protein
LVSSTKQNQNPTLNTAGQESKDLLVVIKKLLWRDVISPNVGRMIGEGVNDVWLSLKLNDFSKVKGKRDHLMNTELKRRKGRCTGEEERGTTCWRV